MLFCCIHKVLIFSKKDDSVLILVKKYDTLKIDDSIGKEE